MRTLLPLLLLACNPGPDKPAPSSNDIPSDLPPSSAGATTSTPTPVCGNGLLEQGEACDPGDATVGDCCADDCRFEPVDTLCRSGSGDACDPDEVCTGDDPHCPADQVAPVTTECASASACSDAVYCSGVASEPCPHSCEIATSSGLVVTIVESQSYVSGQDMDERWKIQAEVLGHTATIVDQTILDDPLLLAGTDVLIVSSGLIDLPLQRIHTLQAWVEGGDSLWVQSEYQPTYPGNVAFQTVANNLGSDFTWIGTVAGELSPVTPTNCPAESPVCVGDLHYFWYGCDADTTDPNMAPFQMLAEIPLGWTYCSPAGGMMMTSSDQDWVKDSDRYPNAPLLMQNILDHLAAAPATCPN